jgi:small subunit ribosomal protein S20
MVRRPPEHNSLANIKSAQKRARQNVMRREHNVAQRSSLRTAIKKVVKAIESGKRDEAEARYREAVPVIDRLTDKGIIHANKAARHKSRLNKRVRAL